MYSTRALRKSGHTQRELAEALGISESAFTQKKMGYRGRHFDERDLGILAEMGVPVAELFPEPDPIEAKS